MPDLLILLLAGIFGYLALVVAHEVIGVLLRLADDCIKFLMRMFGVRRNRRKRT